MGTYDDISPEELTQALTGLASEILRLQGEGTLLASLPAMQARLGELRQMLFAYEVRLSRHLGGVEEGAVVSGEEDPVLRESLRVIREAVEREEEMLGEWDGSAPWDEDDDD